MDNNLASKNSILNNLVVKVPPKVGKEKYKNVNKKDIGTPSDFKHEQHLGITKSNEFEISLDNKADNSELVQKILFELNMPNIKMNKSIEKFVIKFLNENVGLERLNEELGLKNVEKTPKIDDQVQYRSKSPLPSTRSDSNIQAPSYPAPIIPLTEIDNEQKMDACAQDRYLVPDSSHVAASPLHKQFVSPLLTSAIAAPTTPRIEKPKILRPPPPPPVKPTKVDSALVDSSEYQKVTMLPIPPPPPPPHTLPMFQPAPVSFNSNVTSPPIPPPPPPIPPPPSLPSSSKIKPTAITPLPVKEDLMDSIRQFKFKEKQQTKTAAKPINSEPIQTQDWRKQLEVELNKRMQFLKNESSDDELDKDDDFS